MRCLTWNLEWAAPSSKRGRWIVEAVRKMDPDVVCYTEVIRDFVPTTHRLEADADYGYTHNGARRKVVLWSKEPWSEVDVLGDSGLPSGRFVSGVTGGIRFVGVCIPWKDAHVMHGRKDRRPWEDHRSYCHGLQRVLAWYCAQDEPICILGDFNQRIPRVSQPQDVADALADALPQGFVVTTLGVTDSDGEPLIDHIVVSPQLKLESLGVLPRTAPDGTRLSDHVGVVANLSTIAAPLTLLAGSGR